MRSTTGKLTASMPRPSGHIPPGAEDRIYQLLSQWTALQMAVHNEWGGPDSVQKYNQLLSDTRSWLFHHNVSELEELENLLHERLLLCFNTEIEDGSTEEVAEQLMIMRNEYLPPSSISQKHRQTALIPSHGMISYGEDTGNTNTSRGSYDQDLFEEHTHKVEPPSSQRVSAPNTGDGAPYKFRLGTRAMAADTD